MNESTEILDLEQNAANLYENYIEPLKLDEDVSAYLMGEKYFMTIDPNRYLETLNKAVASKTEILNAVKKIEVTGELKKINEVVIKKFQIEVEYLHNLQEAIKTADLNKVSTVEQDYKKKQQNLVHEFNGLNYSFKENINKKADSLNSIREKVNVSYSLLKIR